MQPFSPIQTILFVLLLCVVLTGGSPIPQAATSPPATEPAATAPRAAAPAPAARAPVSATGTNATRVAPTSANTARTAATSTNTTRTAVVANLQRKTFIETPLGRLAKEDIDALVNDSSKFNFNFPTYIGSAIGGGFAIVLMFVTGAALTVKSRN